MVRFPKVLLGLFVALGVTIAGCNGATDIAEPPPAAVETPAEDTVEDRKTTTDDPKATADAPIVESQTNDTDLATDAKPDMVAVSIYVMDDSCSTFKAESVEVPAAEAMSEAVGEVLDRHSFEAFKLSGYRVKIDENSTATVDLRLADDSERQFLSLSSCEQQGLFGGLKETLMQNPSWQVNQVEFTNRGKEIVL